MSRTWVIARRELASYFFSPIAYVALTLFLLACGICFMQDFQAGQPASMRHLFDWMIWLLVVILPVLCMGLLAQEWASGTIETLMTAPVGETAIVLGKFFGSLLFLSVLLLPTLVYVLMLWLFGPPEFGPIFTGYIGILLCGALFIAISLFFSSLTRSQIIAAVSSAAVLVAITIGPYEAVQRAFVVGFWRQLCDQAVYSRYADFSKGVLDSGNVLFFLIATGVFLFLTTKVMESRRWK